MREEWGERSGASHGEGEVGTPAARWRASAAEPRPVRARRRRGGQRGTSVVRGGRSHGQAAVRRGPRALDGGEAERRSTLSRWERMRERAGEADLSKQRDFLRRYRAPIIGLSLAGAALPMAGGKTAAPARAPAKRATAAAAVTKPGAELEEEIGQRWRAAAEEAAGVESDAAIVDRAVGKYDISRDLAQQIVSAAKKNDIDPDLALGLVKTESTFDDRAVSHVGARGLTQVMPATARWLRPGTTAEDLFDPRTNLDLGFSYLRDLIDKYNGDKKLALLAYNRGPGTVDKILKRGGDPDNGYADKVMRG